MKDIVNKHPLMAEAGEESGGSTTEQTPSETTTSTTADAAHETVLDDTKQTQTPEAAKTEEKTESAPTTPTEPESLLDDEKKADPQSSDTSAPTEEQIGEFTKSIKAIDLGDGVTWDDDALKAMTPDLMNLCEGDAKKAEGLVKAYTSYKQSVAKTVAEKADAFNKELISQCRTRFGSDLKQVVEYARIGGKEIFGDVIWNEMKKVPSFANNPEIVEKLAGWGRKFASDSGRITPRGDDAPKQEGDVLHRMYGNVKV